MDDSREKGAHDNASPPAYVGAARRGCHRLSRGVLRAWGQGNDLDPYLLTVSQTAQIPGESGRLTEPVSTPWVTYPGLYSASCKHAGGATWLQVTSLAGASHTRPVVNDDAQGNLGGTGPAWGYHGYEYWLTLGNLLQDVAGAEAAFQARH
jgi:hypothetical protein